MTLLTDLPEDILNIITSFLDARSFLVLCRTCRGLYHYHLDPTYWRNITSSTFRLPVSPLLKADGARWYSLYRRLRTQTKLYTWGQGIKGNLGPGRSSQPPRIIRGRRPLMMRPPIVPFQENRIPSMIFQRTSSSWPTEVHVPADVGVIADLQCGGFSTSILTSKGELYTVGLIDSLDDRIIGEQTDEFKRLEYLTQSTSAIRQFSAGRKHILALTDDGDILSWDRINAKGLKVFSQGGRDFGGKAIRVAAGWGESSAYIPETGIVYWIPIENNHNDEMLDGVHVAGKVIPSTARSVTKEGMINDVVKHVVLESWIVWLTSEGKIYACELRAQTRNADRPLFPPFEVPGYASSARAPRDVQGQFNKFAVFTENGEVLAGNTDYLRLCAEKSRAQNSPENQEMSVPPAEWPELEDLVRLRPADVPALQHNQVISLAFGDHHYQALHVNGTVTSHGNEPQSCGALGLGDMPSGARFRGLTKGTGWRPDSKLLPDAERRGRQIWFEPEKREWLKYLEDSYKDCTSGDLEDVEGDRNDVLAPSLRKRFMFSEWVEQEGRHWQEGPFDQKETVRSRNTTTVDDHDFHLDTYFVLAVSAAGWHSGALVLVDEEKAEVVRQKWIFPTREVEDDSTDKDDNLRPMPGQFQQELSEAIEQYAWRHEGFPTVRLPDESDIIGHSEPKHWRDGMPTISELGLNDDTPVIGGIRLND